MLSEEEITMMDESPALHVHDTYASRCVKQLIATIRELKDAAARSANTIDGLIVQRDELKAQSNMYRTGLELIAARHMETDEGEFVKRLAEIALAPEALKDE